MRKYCSEILNIHCRFRGSFFVMQVISDGQKRFAAETSRDLRKNIGLEL